MEEFHNKNEYRIISLKKTGHHLLIWWMIYNCKESVFFKNNLPLKRNNRFIWKSGSSSLNQEWQDSLSKLNVEFEYETPRKYLLYNHESFLPKTIHKIDPFCSSNHKNSFGNSKNYYEITILRDFPNLVASTLEGAVNELPKLIEMYNEFASYFFNKDHSIFTIKFDEFIQNNNYRQKLARKLNIPFYSNRDQFVLGLQVGPKFKKEKKSNIFNRWKDLKKNDSFINILKKNPEAIENSRKIFGHSKELEKFLNKF